MKLLLTSLALLFCWLQRSSAETCMDLMSQDETTENREKILACQLYETAVLVAEMGAGIVDGMEQLIADKGIEAGSDVPQKRKHEYLRFGKRKHEYLRFGKRKHEYLRFGKRKHEYLRFGKRDA